MSSTLKLFFPSVTGYVNGSVLERFQNHPDASSFEITAIVRSPQKAEKFKEFGINAVVGSFGVPNLVEDLTAAADVVVDIVNRGDLRSFRCDRKRTLKANADGLELTKNMLRGFKRRFQETGKPSIYIHTRNHRDDADPNQLDQLPPTAFHRDVDLEIIQADKEGYVRAYLVSPGTIYGIASGKFVDAGLANKHSIQIPLLIKASLARGQTGVMGKGVNIWPNVHIDEVADFYIDLYNAIKANPDVVGHGCEGYYFLLNGEHVLYDVSEAVGHALVALGRATSEVPTTFTQEEVNKYFNGIDYFGSNSRSLANYSRSIRWKPKKTTQDFLASIQPEMEEIIKSMRL